MENNISQSEAVVHKICFGLCSHCAWRYNGGCSEWNGFKEAAN